MTALMGLSLILTEAEYQEEYHSFFNYFSIGVKDIPTTDFLKNHWTFQIQNIFWSLPDFLYPPNPAMLIFFISAAV